ncbi:MAG: aminopeptidase P family protein [Clostridia bacterium]|nr:aminopeptidase P family protein [Clostridia bacterium]
MKLLCPLKSAYLITDKLTRKYFTGVDLAEGFLFIVNGGMVIFTDARYFYQANKDFNAVGVEARLYSGQESLAEFIKEQKIRTLFIDYSRTTVKEEEGYKKLVKRVKDFSSELEKIRSIKNDGEIALIKKACEICEKAYHQEIVKVKEGITELELKSAIEKAIIKLGGDGPAFDIIVAFGENGAVPHHQTGNTKLKKDMPILIDMGASYRGYLSDLTRTAYFGSPSEKFLRCYQAVLDANLLAEEKIKAGMTTDTADGIARQYLCDNGLGDYFTHSLGHGVGLEIHEYPALSKRRRDEIKEGMVVTIEPGVYFDGEFGIRIEDTVLIKGGKVERLFTDSKELKIL